MKKSALLFVMLVLAGCGAVPRTAVLNDLREPMYLRATEHLPQEFAQIQMALFKHQKACGVAPQFTVDPLRPSYATIIQKLPAGQQAEPIVLIDLVLQDDRTVKARAYTYYAGHEPQIQQIFNAIKHPELCE